MKQSKPAIHGPYSVDRSDVFYMPRGVKRYPDKHKEWAGPANSAKFQTFLNKWVLPGHLPSKKLFHQNSNIFTMGSCFAANLSDSLEKNRKGGKGYNNTLHTPSSVNNTFAIYQFFKWALTGEIDANGYWYEGDASKWIPKNTQIEFKEWLSQAEGFVFTMGLSEIWKDLETNKVFWRAVPSDLHKKNKLRYKFELSTVDENLNNIKNLIRLIKEHLGEDIPIILTISPVPLMATFRNISCITADNVSKSILRVAVDSVMNMGMENVYYWPSYEIIKEISAHRNFSGFYTEGEAGKYVPRHVTTTIVDEVIKSFMNHYFK